MNELYENGDYITITNLIQKLSEKYKTPPSTLRWNAKKLYELGLIECGTYLDKSKPARLTDLGYRFFAEFCEKFPYEKNDSTTSC